VTITGNFAPTANGRGGGLYNEISTPELINATITGNTAGTASSGYGGGIYNNYTSGTGAALVLSGGTISGNTAGSGGGIYINLSVSTPSPVLTNVKSAGNTATIEGGGVYIDDSSPVLTNVTITGNRSAGNAGGIATGGTSAAPVLTNVTIAGNYAGGAGKGINIGSGAMALRNRIIWGNSAGASIDSSTGTTISYSIVEGAFVSNTWVAAIGSNGGGNVDTTSLSNPGFGTYTVATSALAQPGGDFTLQIALDRAVNLGSDALYPDTWAKWSADTAIAATLRSTTFETGFYIPYILPYITDYLDGTGGNTRFNGPIDIGAYEYYP
jgi:hypothetical protein